MKILYIGDIMGRAGRETVRRVLPELRQGADFVVAQAENADDFGKGPRPSDIKQMTDAGVDFFTGGNHSFSNPQTNDLYNDPDTPLVRPANVVGQSGSGYKIVNYNGKRILIASFLGQTVGSGRLVVTNPLDEADKILSEEAGNFDLSVFNFHGDFSSEKRVFGYYLDGRVTTVVGDHWHVPTADAMILPDGTAHITDVGMCGSLHSSLGVKTNVIIERWKTGKVSRNEMEESAPYQFNAVAIETDDITNKPISITQVQEIIR